MMNYRYSLHKIEDDRNCPFSEQDYSLFKFGRISFAEKFAHQLCEGFISENADLILKQDEIVLMPSPYFAIPTASNFLCTFFKENLNRFLFLNDRKACVESKIHRNQTYVEDYGNMSFEERLNCLKNLRDLGYEVGSGILVGLPNQTLESIAKDILFFKEINLIDYSCIFAL